MRRRRHADDDPSEPTAYGRQPWLLRRIVALGVLAGMLAAGFGVFRVAFPASDEPFADGPIVVLGGDSDRLDHALDFYDGRRELVLSSSALLDWQEMGRSCADEQVTCFIPEPHTTRGEAIRIGELADERGWDRVTVVTSDFHVTRSRLLISGCVDIDVAVVGAPTQRTLERWVLRAGREIAAAAVALVDPPCP